MSLSTTSNLTNTSSRSVLSAPTLTSRFVGCLVGAMIGDTFGAPVKGWTSARVSDTLRLMRQLPKSSAYRGIYDDLLGPLSGRGAPARYPFTDDTQMIVATTESLIARRGFDGADVAARLGQHFDPRRSYGAGVYGVIQSVKRGVAWNEAGQQLFNGEGSQGSGGAARVTPVALFYHKVEAARLRLIAAQSAAISDAHPLGREGAVLQAHAVVEALHCVPAEFVPLTFLQSVTQTLNTGSAVYQTALRQVEVLLRTGASAQEAAHTLVQGGVLAVHTVPAALLSFLRHPHNLMDCIYFAAQMGGDTDTVAALAGSLVGALNGDTVLPHEALAVLENDARGRDHLGRLAVTLARTIEQSESDARSA